MMIPRRFATLLTLLLLTAPALAQTRVTPQSREQLQFSFAPVVRKTAPAVVNVYSRRTVRTAASPLFDDPLFRRFFGENAPFSAPTERVQRSLGSGVLVASNGTIVTNHHVIKEAKEGTIVLADRREFEAKILRSDERTDLAVLKIDVKGEQLPFLELRDSDELEVGDLVLAIGNPFGVGQTVTSGIVSALARTAVGISDFRFFIQTDAAVNPGNSGAALVACRAGTDREVEVVLSAPPEDPPRDISELAGKTPLSGATIANLSPALADELGLDSAARGVIILAVTGRSPAARIGFVGGDILATIHRRAGTSVPQTRQLPRETARQWQLALRPEGKTLTNPG